MEPRRPKSPVSLFYVAPEPRRTGGHNSQDGSSVFSGSSRGSSTIKASRSNLFRFSKPKPGDDHDKKKTADSKDPVSAVNEKTAAQRLIRCIRLPLDVAAILVVPLKHLWWMCQYTIRGRGRERKGTPQQIPRDYTSRGL
jgi:hypothetical protein